MPSIAGRYNPSVGPILQIAVLDPDAARRIVAEGQPLTTSTFYNALLDTGATSTCISPRVVQEVGPKPTGKAQMIGATGVEAKNTYHFGVGFLLNPVQQPSGLMAGNLSVMELDGMEFSYEGTGFDVLLGRDVLCKGAFSLSFDGHFILSF